MDATFYGLIDRPVLLLQGLRRSRFWRSIFRREHLPQTETDCLTLNRRNFFVHLLPATIPKRSLRLGYNWLWMGVIAFWLLAILTVSGLYLVLYYVPSVERALDSVRLLGSTASGRFVRNLHRWAGELVVLAVLLHMLRVFYTGAYQRPREFNWVIGVLLLLVTVVFAFSGYILPWDPSGRYAAELACRLLSLGRGDCEGLGQPTLSSWYALHVVFLPLLAGLLIALHFWRIRKDGYGPPPEGEG